MNSQDFPEFDQFIGIDYSGAGTATSPQKGIAVYSATRNSPAIPIQPMLKTERRKNWSRRSLYTWLDGQFSSSKKIIVGIDHAFSFPISYFDRFEFKNWDELLTDFVHYWPTHQNDVTVQQFREGNPRSGNSRDLRITDRWTPGAKSVFQFDVQGSVAKSTHAGLPFLSQIRKRYRSKIHFWPFDGWKPKLNQSVICEIFPTLFRNRFERENRTVDQQDAYAVCRWLKSTQQLKRFSMYFDPPLNNQQRKIARKEGWILGTI